MNNTITLNSFRTWLVLPALFAGLLTLPAVAGDEYSEEHIMREISYLAKKLLDMSGEETVTVKSPAYVKPFIGICTEISTSGVKLTCVTPGTQAAKAGLQTGDVMLTMRGENFVNDDDKDTKRAYFNIVENMKTGEKITIALMRDGERREIVVTVGSLSHPGYVLEVTR